MAEEEGEFAGCPHCGTMLLMVPNLKLLYSTCCGRKMCEDCVSALFRQAKAVDCSVCGKRLDRKCFVDTPLERQQYDADIKWRTKISKICHLMQDDFDSLDQYNDYLEMIEDLVADFSEGSEADKQTAHMRLGNWRKENEARIIHRKLKDESSRREMQDALQQQQLQLASSSVTAANSNAMPSLSLPSSSFLLSTIVVPLPLPDKPLVSRLQERDTSTMTEEEKAFHEYSLALVRAGASVAGGFRAEYDLQRSKEEAMAGLFFGLIT